MLIISSRREGGPRVALEALLRGIKVISTKVGHMPDILDETYLCNPDSLDSLSNLLKDSINEISTIDQSPAFEKVRTEVANLNSFVQERISGIKIVQIFSRESLEIKNFQEINSRHKDAWLKTVWINSIFFPIAEISTSICIGLLVWYGGFNNIQGDNISLGTLFLFISMSGLLFRPLRQIADRFNTLAEESKKLENEKAQVHADFTVKNAQYSELEQMIKEETAACSVETPQEG